MWFILGKNEEAELKISLHRQTVPWLPIKYWQRTMVIWCFLTKLLQLKVQKSADIRRHKHFSWTLHSSNSVRMHWIIIVLSPFLISIRWTTGQCKLIFNWAPFIFTQFEPHGFTCSEPCCAHIKRPIFWKLPGLGIFNKSFLIADMIKVMSGTMITFSHRVAAKNQI